MAITPLIQEYIVDFASNNNFFFVNAVQGDGHNVRYVQLSLTNNGHPYAIPTDGSATIVIRGKTPNGDQYLDTETGEIIDNSTIRFELKQSMIWYAGKGKFEVCVVSNSTNQLLTSFPFYVCVAESGFDTRGITEQPEFVNLIQVLGTVNGAVEDCKNATDNANKSIANVNTAVYNANTAASKANNAASKVDDEITKIDNKISETNAVINAAEEATADATRAAETIFDITDAVLDRAGINDSNESYATTWSSKKISDHINTKFKFCPSIFIDGSVELNIDMPDMIVLNYDNDVLIASEDIEHEHEKGTVTVDVPETVVDDGNGNVTITTE